MSDSTLLHELVEHAWHRSPTALALTAVSTSIDYQTLQRDIERFASSLVGSLGLRRGERVAIFLEKRFEGVITAFHTGARVVLLNYLMPRDVLKAMELERVTGLTAVPPLHIQLAQLEWPAAVQASLRYFANTGGRMPRETLALLRQRVPLAKPFLMYGLTEVFRSTYLPPDEVDRRPDSIGNAIPNAEILVLRENGTECDADEPGELVHRGALVGMGYWNDAEKTAERYRVLPPDVGGRDAGLPEQELAARVHPAHGFGCQQAARTQTPEPQRCRSAGLQPLAGQADVVDPGLPTRIAEVARTVAAAEQIDLEHRVPGVR
jgi:acyl-CoA synthetase (AMP-forming)/AMP-acid ligase II